MRSPQANITEDWLIRSRKSINTQERLPCRWTRDAHILSNQPPKISVVIPSVRRTAGVLLGAQKQMTGWKKQLVTSNTSLTASQRRRNLSGLKLWAWISCYRLCPWISGRDLELKESFSKTSSPSLVSSLASSRLPIGARGHISRIQEAIVYNS